MENSNNLSIEEQKRVDELLMGARKFHYYSFTLAGVSFLISSLSSFNEFKLSFGSINIPKLQAIVSIYLIVMFFTIASAKFFYMVEPFMKLDERRPPFAWIALRAKSFQVEKWLIIPSIICCISTMAAINEFNPDVLAFLVFTLLAPSSYKFYYKYSSLMKERKDERGGHATYSIYLLYWYRYMRWFLVLIGMLLIIISIIPAWDFLNFGYTGESFGAIFMVALILRTIMGSFYKRIDKFGTRYGFPEKSDHY